MARDAMAAALDHGAAAAWLSGSGPTVAIVAADAEVEAVVNGLPPAGKVLHLDIDEIGAVVDD